MQKKKKGKPNIFFLLRPKKTGDHTTGTNEGDRYDVKVAGDPDAAKHATGTSSCNLLPKIANASF
jgi:hypothetical protein